MNNWFTIVSKGRSDFQILRILTFFPCFFLYFFCTLRCFLFFASQSCLIMLGFSPEKKLTGWLDTGTIAEVVGLLIGVIVGAIRDSVVRINGRIALVSV